MFRITFHEQDFFINRKRAVLVQNALGDNFLPKITYNYKNRISKTTLINGRYYHLHH